jgi:hypothetical protein
MEEKTDIAAVNGPQSLAAIQQHRGFQMQPYRAADHNDAERMATFARDTDCVSLVRELAGLRALTDKAFANNQSHEARELILAIAKVAKEQDRQNIVNSQYLSKDSLRTLVVEYWSPIIAKYFKKLLPDGWNLEVLACCEEMETAVQNFATDLEETRRLLHGTGARSNDKSYREKP